VRKREKIAVMSSNKNAIAIIPDVSSGRGLRSGLIGIAENEPI